MKIYLEKPVLIGFILTMLVLTFLVWYSISNMRRLGHTAQMLSYASRVIGTAEQVMKSAVDIETSQRGYVITGNEIFLEPGKEARGRIHKQWATLDSLTTNNPEQKQRASRLKELIDAHLQRLQLLIEARTRSFEEAKALIASGEGKEITDEIRSIIRSIQDDARSNFRTNNTVTAKTLRQFQYSFASLVLTAAVIVIYLFYRIHHGFMLNRKIEAQLTRAAAETQYLYDNAPCGYFSVNNQIVITNINNRLLQWLGYPVGEVIGKMQFADLLSDENRIQFEATFAQDFEKYKRDKVANDLEFEFKRKDGTTLQVIVNSVLEFDTAGEFAGSHTTVFDNTERKKTHDKFRGLLEAAPDASVIVNEQGIIEMANRQCSVVFEFSREELIGKAVEILMPERYRKEHPHHRKIFTTTPSIRPMGSGLQLWGARKNGEEFPIEISLSPIQTADGLLVSASIRDITERKRSEQVILKLNQELESFTYSVSHDLRAPLRSVVGYAQILKEDYAENLDEEAKRLTGIIIKNARRMGQLIDDLLDFSRMRRTELLKARVDMNQLVADVMKESLEQFNHPKLPEVVVEKEQLPSALADVNMLRQVWSNLISNALKYSSKKDNIHISIGACENFTEGYNCYYVRDKGVGFDMQYADKLFNVFQRLHKMDEFEGTGVGLALVKRVVDRHGGKVWAEATLNEGAVFYFTLPNSPVNISL